VNKIPPKKCIHFETDKPIAVGQSYLSVWHWQKHKKKF
jgi:hypothetical protein